MVWWVVLGLAACALADDDAAPEAPKTPRWAGRATLVTTFVGGPLNRGVTTDTLDGAVDAGATFNPRLDLGLGLGVSYRVRTEGALSASWSVSRDVVFSDGLRTRNGGTSSSQVLDTGDLVLSYDDAAVVSSAKGRVSLTTTAGLVVPMSRTSIVCDPRVGGAALGLGSRTVLGPDTRLFVGATVSATAFLHAAPPRGRCAIPLRDPVVDTLDGSVTAPDAGGGFAGTLPAPWWSTDVSAVVQGWHGLFGLIPGVSTRRAYQRVVSDVSVGLRVEGGRRDPATTVDTLDGPVDVAAARTPVDVRVPFRVGVGGRLTDRLTLRGTLSNTVPTLLYDASARFAALPSTTAVSLSLTGTW